MLRTVTLLAALLAGCTAAPDTSAEEQALCTIQDQAAGTCPGQEGCVPLDWCGDYDLQGGTCCIYYGHPKSPTSVNAVVCGDDPTNNNRPTCISHNHYDFGIVKVDCTTVIVWYILMDGSVEKTVSTECTLG